MNTSDYKRPLTVGIFIFIGIVIFVAGVFTVGSQRRLFDKKIALNIIFDDVGGLQAGNNVWLSGVKIGTVKKISFHGSSQVQITLNIEKDAQPHICRNALAKISTDGFIGNKIVVIYSGTMDAGTVSDGDFLQSGKSVTMDDMVSTLQTSNKNLLEITGNFKKIAQKLSDGEGTLGKLINDPSIANNLRATLQHLKAASHKTENAVNNVEDFTNRLDKQNGLVNELISDTTVFENVKEAVTQLRNAAATASAFMDTMHKVSASLNEKDNPVGMLLKDKEVAQDLKTMISNLKSSSQKLDEDLEALQHNFLFRGFFRKKAKTKSN